jgi:long-chain acyl-CoA synthetase
LAEEAATSMYTIADPLNHAERVSARRVATVCGDTRHDYAELVSRCRRLGAALARAGIGAGERVAILADNSHQYIEVYAGVPAAGRVVVPMNTRHAEPELLYALKDCGARILLTDRDPGKLAGCVDRVVHMTDEYESLLAGEDEARFDPGIRADSLAGLFYTGGTTGASKGVMLSHYNLIANSFHWMGQIPHQSSDKALIIAPLFHAAGSNGVFANIWAGGAQVVLESFDATRALDLIESEGCTSTLGVPTMLSALAEEQSARPRGVDSLRMIIHGGSPIATELLRRVHGAFSAAELVEIYGATELSPLATVQRHEETLLDSERIRSCGQALAGVDVAILGEDAQELKRDEIGEVTVRGPTVMQGYWNKAEQTSLVLKEGRYWTGDLGYIDDEGFVFLVDRSKDMIVSGGENVYSTEVEEVLYLHPAVLEAAVFGVPDEKWGEAVWAAVHLREGQGSVGVDALLAHCREHLGGYKVPKGIDVHTEVLPKSGPGKLLKRSLRAPYWEGRERAIH